MACGNGVGNPGVVEANQGTDCLGSLVSAIVHLHPQLKPCYINHYHS